MIMKKVKSTSKLSYRLINIIMQLLRWMTKLELSGGPVGETDIGLSPPEKGCELQVAGFLSPNSRHSELRTLKENRMKPNTRLTKQFMQLLRWMAHLELSGGIPGEQDIKRLMPEPAFADLINGNKNFKNINQNENKMKTKNRMLKWLALLFVLIAGTTGAIAGPYPNTGTQTVCITGLAEPYGVDPTAGSTYVWTVVGGTAGTDWVLTATNTNLASVVWKTAGTYKVQVLETTDKGCTQPSPVDVDVIVNPLPTATIAGTAAVCQNGTAPDITFTGTGGTAPYTFTYTINGGAPLTVTTTSGSSVTVSAPTGTTGAFIYALTGVQDASGTTCSQAQAGTATITVNPLPTATIAGTAAVCQNGTAPDITFTGTGGTAPYTFTYTINGGAPLTVTTTSGSSVTVSAPTGTTGAFIYALTGVQDASGTTCSQAQAGTATITVNPLPTATIAGSTEVCQNATAPNVTFTGAGGTAPYTFTYTLNGGAPLTITTTSGSSVTVSVPTATAGTFTYVLTGVQDASGTTCTQTQTGTATVTITPIPTTSAIFHN
jgi:hypothetical protein